MGINNWLTDAAINAIFDKLEKGPIRISGIDPERDLVIWVAPTKKEKK
jgi:hypothetical protein